MDIIDNLVFIKKEICIFLKKYLSKECNDIILINKIIIDNLNDVGLPFRPYLYYLSSDSSLTNIHRDIRIASGIELMQLSTLIIDDYFDSSKMRNLQPSLCIKLNEKKSVAIGNIISFLGLSLIINSINQKENSKNIKDISGLLSKAFSSIYYGQYLDIHYTGSKIISESQYIDMITQTTAIFIKTCLLMGAIVSNYNSALLCLLDHIGCTIGIAYQVRDDIIDIIGSEDYTGKPKAIDIKQKRMRLPLINALKNGNRTQRQLIRNYLSDTKQPIDEEVCAIIDVIYKTGSIEYSIEKVKRYTNQAIKKIDKIKDCKLLKSHLLEVCDLISTF